MEYNETYKIYKQMIECKNNKPPITQHKNT